MCRLGNQRLGGFRPGSPRVSGESSSADGSDPRRRRARFGSASTSSPRAGSSPAIPRSPMSGSPASRSCGPDRLRLYRIPSAGSEPSGEALASIEIFDFDVPGKQADADLHDLEHPPPVLADLRRRGREGHRVGAGATASRSSTPGPGGWSRSWPTRAGRTPRAPFSPTERSRSAILRRNRARPPLFPRGRAGQSLRDGPRAEWSGSAESRSRDPLAIASGPGAVARKIAQRFAARPRDRRVFVRSAATSRRSPPGCAGTTPQPAAGSVASLLFSGTMAPFSAYDPAAGRLEHGPSERATLESVVASPRRSTRSSTTASARSARRPSRWLHTLDRRGLVDCRPIVPDGASAVSTRSCAWRTACASFTCSDPDGRILTGWDAVAALARLFPPTWIVGALGRIPPFRWLGRAAYRFVAANRYSLSSAEAAPAGRAARDRPPASRGSLLSGAVTRSGWRSSFPGAGVRGESAGTPGARLRADISAGASSFSMESSRCASSDRPGATRSRSSSANASPRSSIADCLVDPGSPPMRRSLARHLARLPRGAVKAVVATHHHEEHARKPELGRGEDGRPRPGRRGHHPKAAAARPAPFVRRCLIGQPPSPRASSRGARREARGRRRRDARLFRRPGTATHHVVLCGTRRRRSSSAATPSWARCSRHRTRTWTAGAGSRAWRGCSAWVWRSWWRARPRSHALERRPGCSGSRPAPRPRRQIEEKLQYLRWLRGTDRGRPRGRPARRRDRGELLSVGAAFDLGEPRQRRDDPAPEPRSFLPQRARSKLRPRSRNPRDFPHRLTRPASSMADPGRGNPETAIVARTVAGFFRENNELTCDGVPLRDRAARPGRPSTSTARR